MKMFRVYYIWKSYACLVQWKPYACLLYMDMKMSHAYYYIWKPCVGVTYEYENVNLTPPTTTTYGSLTV